MKRYFISKSSYNGEVVYLNVDKNSGYKVSPKNNLKYDGIKVNEMIFIKPDLIKKIIKRKIKNKLDYYLNFLISDDENNDSDARKALDELQRYRYFVKEKYNIFLDEKYISLLNNKFDILERNLKSKFITKNKESERKIIEEEHTRSR